MVVDFVRFHFVRSTREPNIKKRKEERERKGKIGPANDKADYRSWILVGFSIV